MLRLYKFASTAGFRLHQYDGTDMITLYSDALGTINKRLVYGPGTDELLVEYTGSGTSSRIFRHADERGSIVAGSDSGGAKVAIDSYDEYGIPGSANSGPLGAGCYGTMSSIASFTTCADA